jgi:putative hemolysin
MRVFWISGALLLAACTTPSAPPSIDPASLSPAKHCEAQGGKRSAERGPDGEIGVCVFADNRQCEEWALLLGECPPGGIAVGGYATTSERHCAIRGGRMTIPGCALSPAGAYETRNVLLVLQAGRTAVLHMVFSGIERTLLGTWQSAGNLITVRTEHERLVLDYAGGRLVPREWDRRVWGVQGPGTLERRK